MTKTMQLPKANLQITTTWQGRVGTLREWRVAGRYSLRVTLIEWADGGNVVKLIKGDGRKADFQEYINIENADEQQIDDMIRGLDAA